VRSVGTPPTDVPDPPLTREAPSDRCIGGVGTSAAPSAHVTDVNCGGVGYSQRVDIPEVLTRIGTCL